jgi:hypothetical protein
MVSWKTVITASIWLHNSYERCITFWCCWLWTVCSKAAPTHSTILWWWLMAFNNGIEGVEKRSCTSDLPQPTCWHWCIVSLRRLWRTSKWHLMNYSTNRPESCNNSCNNPWGPEDEKCVHTGCHRSCHRNTSRCGHINGVRCLQITVRTLMVSLPGWS